VLVALEAVVLALVLVLVAGLLRSHAEILRSLHELGVGEDPARMGAGRGSAERPPGIVVRDTGSDSGHDVAGETPHGDAVAIGVVGAEHSTLLAFLSSGCTTCHAFWRALADERRSGLPGDTRVVVVTMGRDAERESKVAELAPSGVPVVMSSDAWDGYGVPGSPYFVYVDGPTGRVTGEGSAQSWDQVVGLVGQALGDGAMDAQRTRAARDGRVAQRARAGARREARADAELSAAGIEPGHPSLYAASGAPDQDVEGSER
jgi:hypothetical protein